MTTVRMRGTRLGAVLTAVGITLAATTAAMAGTRVAEETGDFELTAVFADASPLVPGNEIKASGATVGSIEAIELVDGLAHVRMSVDRSVLPIHTDATATVTEKDVLGERYIALERGTPAAPVLEEPIVIPEARTDRKVDLQEVLNSVDDPTAKSLFALVTTLGEGVDGRDEDIAKAIEVLAPAMRQADELGRLLSDQNAVLTELLDTSQPVLAALTADRGKKLDSMVGSTEALLSTVSAHRESTRAALERLPATLQAAQRTLAQTAGVAESVTPTLAGMRPFTDQLTDISGELLRFSDATDPALASMRPVLERADTLLDEAAPFVDDLAPAGDDIRALARDGRPLVEEAFSGKLTNLMQFLKQWSLITNGYDGVSHYFRAGNIDPTQAGALDPNPAVPPSPPPALAPPEMEGAPAVPELRTNPEGPPVSTGDGATGLTEQQENDMLGQLLGGR